MKKPDYVINPLALADMIRLSLGDAMEFTSDMKCSLINFNFDSNDDLDDIIDILTSYDADLKILINLLTIYDNAMNDNNPNMYFANRFNLIRYLSMLDVTTEENDSYLLTLIRFLSKLIAQVSDEEINSSIYLINLLENKDYLEVLKSICQEEFSLLKAFAILVNIPPVENTKDIDIFGKTKGEITGITLDRLITKISPKNKPQESRNCWEENIDFHTKILSRTFLSHNIN